MSDEPRVAILLAGVGQVGRVLLDEAMRLFGPQPGLHALQFDVPVDDVAARERLAREVARVDAGRGVVVLTDLCGSTLANLCFELARQRPDVDVVCGVSLAMLTKIWSLDRRRVSPQTLARQMADTGRRGVSVASERFAGDREKDRA